MNRLYLNIGLWHAGTKDEMLVHHALAQVEATAGFEVRRIALVRVRDEEPSLVVECETHCNQRNAETLVWVAAQALKQDCIAVWWPEHGGKLIGPKAANWGAFDQSKFHFL